LTGSVNLSGSQCAATSAFAGFGSAQASACVIPTTTTSATTASTTRSTSQPATTSPSAAPCFHETTLITYKTEKSLKMSDFENHAECRIPHKVMSNGVRIETVDGHVLRLTDDHLVFTSRGLIPAGSIVYGDTLFTSIEARIDASKKDQSQVSRVTAETNQLYFGLNCLESIVLANGLKTSTFGKYHAVPVWWMRVVGSVLGSNRASSIGDTLVELLAKVKLV
jgi:hypothetical protein